MQIEPEDADMKENVVKTKFHPGDLVFAKMKGYPTWPAKVLSVVSEKLTCIKYSVYFFGTGNSAVCTEKNVFAYAEAKALYGKPLKYRGFQRALDEIQEAASFFEQDMDNSEHMMERDMDDGEALIEHKAESDFERVSEETKIEEKFEVAANTWNMESKENDLKRENDDVEKFMEPEFVPINVDFEGLSEESKEEISESTEISNDQATFVLKQKEICEEIKEETMSPLSDDILFEETIRNETRDGENQKNDRSKEKMKEVRVQMQRLEESTDPEVQAYFARLKMRHNFSASLSAEEAPYEEDEDCAAATCLRPTGSQVLWVQCDARCNKWFHFLCEGLEENDINDYDEYICNTCKTQSIPIDPLPSSSSELPPKSAEPSMEAGHCHVEREQKREGGILAVDPLSLSCAGMAKVESYPCVKAAASGNESSYRNNRLLRMECSFQIATGTPSGEAVGMKNQEYLPTNSSSKHTILFLQNQQCQTFAVASCSTTEGTIGQEGATWGYLSEGQEENQIAEDRERQRSPLSERGRCAGSEVTHFEREMQTSAALRSSSEESECQGSKRTFECSTCKTKFPSKYLLRKHMRVHTGEDPYKCSECEKSFNTSSNLTRHLRIHKGEKAYKCSQCEKSFYQKDHLIRHIRFHTGEKPYRCSECEKSFISSSNLTRHLQIHKPEKPYKCSLCEKSFNQKGHLTRHLQIQKGEKAYKCSQCEKSFYTSSYLTWHLQIHKVEKAYKCSQCEKSFNTSSYLTRHLRIHKGEKPYKCSQCEKSFNTSSDLTRHLRIHKGEKPYKCSQCEKSFNTSSDLTRHLRIHKGEKPYKCSQCEKSFNTSSDLTRHLRIHKGEKPYKCSQCEKSFNTSSDLTRHLRIHKREKPYKCSQCEKSFNTSSDLSRHLRIHKGVKAYKCSQ